MRKKWTILLLLLICFSLVATACGVKTKDEAKGTAKPSEKATDAASTKTEDKAEESQATTEEKAQEAKREPVDVTILAMSMYEKDVNVLRDQLSKAGFNVKINMQPDYGSWSSQIDAGNYDIVVAGWTTVTGNPDYAVRSIFQTGGDYNRCGISDAEIDKLIDEAAAQTPDEYVKTYAAMEKILVEDHAYIIPMYSAYRFLAVNKELIKPESVILCKSRTTPWERVEFQNESDNASKEYIMSQVLADLTSLDPIKANDGSINAINSNMYIRLVNLTPDDQVVADGSLSYQFAIADGNGKYYFLLRDNVNFAVVEDGKAVDSGVRVGAEDVVFSMRRARDKNSVPDHRTYTLHSSMKDINIISDLSLLDGKAANGETLRSVLEAQAPSAIKELTEDKRKADNQAGIYQLVCIETTHPFPQVLNFLAHQSAGIVCKEQVEKINSFKVEEYDREKDIAYGDPRTVAEGSANGNQLMTSGPYILIGKNDYQADFQKNPGYMKGTEYEPRIAKVVMKFIKEADSALSSFRSGEIHSLAVIPEDKMTLLEQDPKVNLEKIPSNGVTYANFNLIKSKFQDENLRKAALYAVDQEAYIKVYNNLKRRAYSTLSTLIDTGNSLMADPDKVAEYFELYYKGDK